MRVYAVVEQDDPEAIDVFLRKSDTYAAIHVAIRDEPQWLGILSVIPIELVERVASTN